MLLKNILKNKILRINCLHLRPKRRCFSQMFDKDICSICLREFRFLFDNKYEDELELIKASKLKKSRLEKEKSLKQLN